MVTILLYLFPNGELNPLDYNSKIHTTGCHQLQTDTLLSGSIGQLKNHWNIFDGHINKWANIGSAKGIGSDKGMA